MVERRLLYTVHTHFGNVRLFKEQELGHGSFATVCRAQCDDLLCAAKVLHADFFDQENPDPGEGNFISKFIKECNILPSITHPNIVQCFGTYNDPETDLPVLLMELMDESLTNYLKCSQDHLPFHTEVSFSYDVALGLSYLHSRECVHRDLSSNNVLIMAGVRAKITDFGMCRAVSGPSFRQTRQTLCPGTHHYMPPEALVEPPRYTDKLDVFSFGVLMIQIMTRKFPEPGPAHRALRTMLHQAIPEDERREKHIKLVSQGHQMLPLAKQCIQNSPDVRPTSHGICNSLRVLKESRDFQKSKDEHRVQQKLEKLSALHEFHLQRFKSAHQEAISRITTNHSQEIEDIHHYYQEQLRMLQQNTQKQLSQCAPSCRGNGSPHNNLHTSDTGDLPPAPKSGFDPMNLPEPAFDTHNLNKMLHQEARTPEDLYASGILSMPAFDSPASKGVSIPFDPMNLPEPAFDTHDLNKMLHQEARPPENPYTSGMLSMLIDPRSTDYDFSGPDLDDHLTLHSHSSGHVGLSESVERQIEGDSLKKDDSEQLHVLGQEEEEETCVSGNILGYINAKAPRIPEAYESISLDEQNYKPLSSFSIGGDTFSDSQLQPPSTDAHQTEQPFVPQPQPRSSSGGPLSISERPPLPRPRSNHSLLSTKHLQTPPPSPGRKKPVAKPAAESMCASKTSKTSLSDSLFDESYSYSQVSDESLMYCQVSDELHNAKPCWYCTNLTIDRVCDVCGQIQQQNI